MFSPAIVNETEQRMRDQGRIRIMPHVVYAPQTQTKRMSILGQKLFPPPYHDLDLGPFLIDDPKVMLHRDLLVWFLKPEQKKRFKVVLKKTWYPDYLYLQLSEKGYLQSLIKLCLDNGVEFMQPLDDLLKNQPEEVEDYIIEENEMVALRNMVPDKNFDPVDDLIRQRAKIEASKTNAYKLPEPAPAEPKTEPTKDLENIPLESLPVKSLRELAKEKNIPNYRKLKKPELLEALKIETNNN